MNSETLKRTIVRVVGNGGTTLGTGFLVSSEGHILTCWHVVESVEYLRVQFEGETQEILAELCFELSDNDADIAVLRIPAPVRRAPAELDPDWRVGDALWSYGYQYQEHFSSGFPVEGRISGDTRIRDQQLIVVSGTDVQRGLSGAPVLNFRTGKVTALVNAKFDDRGIGFAVPIAAATRHWADLEGIIAQNSGRFRENTAKLFKAMGYQVTLQHRIQTGGLASFYAELSTGATRLRAIVGCSGGGRDQADQGIEDALFSLQTAVARGKLDLAFLITLDGHPRDAEETAESVGVRLLSYDELQGSLIDFSGYLQTVVHDFESFGEYSDLNRIPIIQPFRWCDLYRYYIDIGCADPLTAAEYPSARAVFEDFLADDTQNHISFLGDYGTGKTTLCLQLTYDLAKAHLENPHTTRIPLFVQLRDLDLRTGVRRLIMDSLAEYGVRVSDYAAFDIMMRSGRFTLILDGFDEVADRLDRRGVIQAFNQISHLTNPRSKIVLTCRTHYFRTENQTYETLTTKTMTPLMREIHQHVNFRVLELLKYDEPRIIEVLSRRSANYLDQWRRMQEIYNLADLARTPILMNFMVNSLEELLTLRSQNDVSSASLYDMYTKFWLDRDDDRSDVTAQERILFAEELAWRMYRDHRLSVPHDELADVVVDFFTGLHTRGAEWLERLDTNIRTCSFLARDRHGNYLFAHKSFMEFFVAKALVRHLDEWSRSDLWPRAVPYEVSSFLSQILLPADIARLKRVSVDRENNDFLRGLCMDVQMSLGDTVKDEPIVFAVGVSPDGGHVASAGADCLVRVFTTELEPVVQLAGHEEWVRCVAYSADDRFFASGAWDNRVIIRSRPSYGVHVELRLPDRVNTIAFTPDGGKILCGGYDRSISIWDVETGEQLDSLVGHTDSVHSIAVNPDDGDVVSGGTDRTLRVWPLGTPGAPPRVEVQDEPIRCVALSPDGHHIATGSWTGELILWDADGLRPLWRSSSHTNMINSFAFAPAGGRFVSCSDDRSVKVWGTESGDLVATLAGVDFVMGTCFSPDGATLYTGGYDSTIRAWDTGTWTQVRAMTIAPGTTPHS